MLNPSKNAFATQKKRYQLVPSVKDKYKRYYTANYTYKVNLRTWQLKTTQQVNYPNLSKLALDILSIPAMSANPKRLFSSAKLLITNLRNKLGIDITKAFKCLKSQYKIKGQIGEFKYLEEVIREEVKKVNKKIGVDHV